MSIIGYFKRTKWFWLIVFVLVITIKLLAAKPAFVEKFYTGDFYPFVSATLRFLFGWLPFSIGDLLYLVLACWLLFLLVKNISLLIKWKLTGKIVAEKVIKLVAALLIVYIVFNILWGLNYDRSGVAGQLALVKTTYDTSDVIILEEMLLLKANENKKALLQGGKNYPSKNELFERAEFCYENVSKIYPFIQYKTGSIKSSFYGSLGNYLGFTGYYNPFSGEAQVNTTVPKFLLPYIATHEMAHQLGYAKEDEANFVGYLAAANSSDTLFRYSAYLDLFIYANREVFYFDSALAKLSMAKLDTAIKQDLLEWRKFNLSHTSFAEPLITWLYGNYLKANQQPAGMRSYNKVVGMLIAYYKKYGRI
ncbi:MAG: DUF3810 domain-containing protein [Ginsengibacter sp.]